MFVEFSVCKSSHKRESIDGAQEEAKMETYLDAVAFCVSSQKAVIRNMFLNFWNL
jgi:hypothetical protein